MLGESVLSARPSRRLHHSAITAPPSMAQVTVIAKWGKRRAGLGRPSMADFVKHRWLRSTRSASLPRGGQLQLRSSWKLFYARQQKAPVRVISEMKGYRAGLTAVWLITPHPPQGGFWAVPSNITRHYAKWPPRKRRGSDGGHFA
ncbi:MAG: hypothetical protein ABW168_26130 [Sedimenticola sp.]